MQLCFLNCCNKQCLTMVCAALCVLCDTTVLCPEANCCFCDVEEQNGMYQNKINDLSVNEGVPPIL
jgi:hypothetical protein